MVEQDMFPNLDGGSISTSPLQLFIRVVNHETATNFYSKWHYLGKTSFISTINYGAFFENICHGVISYGIPNAKKMKGYYDENSQNGWWEIKRLAMTDFCPKNSESRFIAISQKILIKSFHVNGIVTMADSSVSHTGIIYKASGFKYLGMTDKKSDYVVNGKKIQRGKVVGLGGQWVERPQKHLFIKDFRKN
jgi:hypothetical protein